MIRTLLIFLLFVGCERNKGYEKLIHHKTTILTDLNNTSLIEREKIIIFSTHQKNLVNSYYFEQKNQNLILINDTIQYDTQIALDSIVRKVNDLIDLIYNINIIGYSSQYSEFGVEFIFYLKEEGVVLYIPDELNLKGEYKKHLAVCKKITDNWWYSDTW